MNKTLHELLNEYGTETVIARILQQLQLLALSKDKECKKVVRNLVKAAICDTEYIYMLCEYTNLMTYVSDNVHVTNGHWQNH
jgi:hypothetical protein